MKKHLIFTAKIVIVLAIFGWIGWELQKSWNKINQIQWQPNYYWLTLSAFFYSISYVPSVFFWRHTMRLLGQNPGWYETFRAYYIGHLGKYIPGKAMVVVLRAGLLNRERTRLSIAAATVALETLNMMAVGGFLSALIVLIWFRDLPNGQYLTFIAFGLMLFVGFPVFPPVFRCLAKRIGVGRGDREVDEKLQKIRISTVFFGWCLMSIDWLLLGLSLWASLRGIGIETGSLADHLPRFVLAATLSVVAGFVLMIPGGLGVREIVITQITIPLLVILLMNTNPNLTKPDAAQLAVLYALVVAGVQRGISILSELFLSAILYHNKQ
ncbi:MAG: lysylphosphatidylglycerol synthase domain-containing protein [Planctomycetaceae bacterium]|nr:lysylphosphatidylglycerol synthase domain-containing protein [Planctomycetaceae bacterium]